MQPNGADTPQSPIEYPKIEIPGKGTFTVKFDLVAQYWLDKNLKMTASEFGEKLQEFLPKPMLDANGNPMHDTEGKPQMIPGSVHPAFLFDVLSACLWKQTHLDPVQLAECFDSFDGLTDIVRALGEAFVKTRWSAKVKLQEPATQAPEPEAKPN
jgi:hypothetical protein